jgi:hypothetical protein
MIQNTFVILELCQKIADLRKQLSEEKTKQKQPYLVTKGNIQLAQELEAMRLENIVLREQRAAADCSCRQVNSGADSRIKWCSGDVNPSSEGFYLCESYAVNGRKYFDVCRFSVEKKSFINPYGAATTVVRWSNIPD